MKQFIITFLSREGNRMTIEIEAKSETLAVFSFDTQHDYKEILFVEEQSEIMEIESCNCHKTAGYNVHITSCEFYH